MFDSYVIEDKIVSRNHLSMRYNQEKCVYCGEKGARNDNCKSQLCITFGISGHRCADCPRIGHNESEAGTAEPFSRPQYEEKQSN